jgi:hypothetical protein
MNTQSLISDSVKCLHMVKIPGKEFCELTHCPHLKNFNGFSFNILTPTVISSTNTVAFPCMNRYLYFIADHSNFCLKKTSLHSRS